MPSKGQKQAELAKQALNSVFDGSHTEDRVPNILKENPAPPPSAVESTPKRQSEPTSERSSRLTGLQLSLPLN